MKAFTNTENEALKKRYRERFLKRLIKKFTCDIKECKNIEELQKNIVAMFNESLVFVPREYDDLLIVILGSNITRENKIILTKKLTELGLRFRYSCYEFKFAEYLAYWMYTEDLEILKCIVKAGFSFSKNMYSSSKLICKSSLHMIDWIWERSVFSVSFLKQILIHLIDAKSLDKIKHLMETKGVQLTSEMMYCNKESLAEKVVECNIDILKYFLEQGLNKFDDILLGFVKVTKENNMEMFSILCANHGKQFEYGWEIDKYIFHITMHQNLEMLNCLFPLISFNFYSNVVAALIRRKWYPPALMFLQKRFGLDDERHLAIVYLRKTYIKNNADAMMVHGAIAGLYPEISAFRRRPQIQN